MTDFRKLPLLPRHASVAGGQDFTPAQWLSAAYALNRVLHTPVLLVSCGLWLALFGFRTRHSQPGATVARLLPGWGVLCILMANLALVVGSDGGAGAQMWFYGDRALRVNAWTISDVQERVRSDTADLLFDFRVQPRNAAASGIVFPRRWEEGFGDIRTYLEGRYPAVSLSSHLSGTFEVFRVCAVTQLSSSSPAQAR